MSAAGGEALQAKVLGAGAAEGPLGREWQRLALGVGDATCFMLPAWFRTWHRVLAEGDEACVIAVRDGETLVGVLPLMRARVWRGPSCVPRVDYSPADRGLVPGGRRPLPLRQLASVVSWPAASLRPTLLAAAADRPAVTRAVAAALLAMPGYDVVVLPVFVGADADLWRAAFVAAGGRPALHELHRDVFTLEAVRPFDAVVAGQPKKFRQNVRRARAAAESFGIDITVHEGRAAVGARFGMLAGVAAESWKHTGRDGAQTALPYAGRQQAFFETLLAEEGTGLEPLLVEARVQGAPIAVLLAVRHAATVTALVTFRDASCAAASPGLLLLGRLIDWSAAKGVQRFDINATQDWVRHIADSRRTLANLVVFAPRLPARGFELLSRAARWAHARRSAPTRPAT